MIKFPLLPSSCTLLVSLLRSCLQLLNLPLRKQNKQCCPHLWSLERHSLHRSAFSCNLHLKNRHLTSTDWLITLCHFMSEAQTGSKSTYITSHIEHCMFGLDLKGCFWQCVLTFKARIGNIWKSSCI